MAYNVFQNCNEYWDFSRKKKKLEQNAENVGWNFMNHNDWSDI